MREIKFRAWDNFVKQMSYTDVSSYMSFNDNGTLNVSSVFGNIAMQYTGLKDKNGIEIYEGDILKDNNSSKEIMVVEYDNSVAGFNISYQLSECILMYEYLEVIGNIYENTELLK